MCWQRNNNNKKDKNMANFLLTQTGEEVQTILNEAPETKEGLQQEVTNREQAITAEEQARDEAIAAEQQAREQAITDEATARADADAALDAKIDAETSRAETAEQTLTDAIAKEVTDRKAAVTAEATAREQADTAQQQALSQETSRAQQAELTNAQAISTEAHARSEADTTLLDNLQEEARTRQNADTVLQNHIDDEEERAKAAESTLQSNIDVIDQSGGAAVAAEQQARADADAALDAKIDAETTRAETAEQTLTDAIAQEVTDREAAVTAEASARADADAALDAKIDAETTRAETAEGTLDDKIDQEVTDRTDAVAAEASAREQADTAQQQALSQETSRAQQAELANAHSISTEAQARTDADTAILDNLQAEARTRLNADTDLQDHIDDEETRAKAAEQTLQGNIDTETQARQQADTTLDGKIAGNTQAIAAEQTRAEGAEQDLQTAIDTINGKIPAQATAQNQLADKDFVNSSISTATADFKGTYNSLEDLEQVTANANDYAFVIATDAAGNTVYKRYKWIEGTGWAWEYDLNNSSFTAAQWAAIQSGITAALVTKLTDLPTNAELNQRISTAITTALTAYYTKTEIDNILAGYVQTGTFNSHTNNTTVHITAAERNAWNAKQAAITDGAQIGLGYGVSSEAATVQARTATIANFLLLKNMPVSIRFTNAINVDSATLNISSTGAKPILIEGAALQPGVVKAGNVVTLIYDGTNWNIVEILNVLNAASGLSVDMGLPSGRLWAIANIDVTKQSGFAEVDGKPSPFIYECTFFSWGNTEGHNPTSTSAFSYDWGTANDGPYAQTPGAQLTANAGLSFDAARAILGAPWRDPSTEDFAELFANIDYVQADGETVIDASQANKLVTVNGIVGIYLKSKINSRLLFFPCSGGGDGQSWYYRGSDGNYWSRSLHSQADGRNLYFNSGGVSPQSHYRFNGFTRRAVQ